MDRSSQNLQQRVSRWHGSLAAFVFPAGLLSSCREEQVSVIRSRGKTTEVAPPSPLAGSAKRGLDLPPNIYPPPDRVSGSNLLVTSILFFERKQDGELEKVMIEADAIGGADYLQLRVCEDPSDESTCDPGTADRRTSGRGKFTIVHPPSSDVILSVRACVHPKNALDPEKLCSEWKDEFASFTIENPPGTKAAEEEALDSSEKILEECEVIATATKAVLESGAKIPPEIRGFFATQENLLTPEMCRDAIMQGATCPGVTKEDQSTGGGGGGSGGEEQGGDKALMWAVIALGSASTLWSLYKAGSAYMKARRILNEGAVDEQKLMRLRKKLMNSTRI